MPRDKDFFGYGNLETKVAHTNNNPGDQCRISEVRPKNRVRFTEDEFIEAIGSGKFRPCKVCANEYIQAE